MSPRPPAGTTESYFSSEPRSRSAPSELRFWYRGEVLVFRVDRGVFGASHLDPGTDLLIENLSLGRRDRVLDLGTGWGPIGVAAAKLVPEGHVTMTEVNRRAAHLAEENLHRNGIRNARVLLGSTFEPVGGERFDVIVTNPPYRAGRAVVLRILQEAPAHLEPNGRLLLVGRGSQGVLFYQGWLRKNWPGAVSILARRSGYRVLEARVDGAKGGSSEAVRGRAAETARRAAPARSADSPSGRSA